MHRIGSTLIDSSASRDAKIIVGHGDAAQTFIGHERVLREHSEYFLGVFRRGSLPLEEHTIRLEEEDPELFGLFATWAYEGRMFYQLEEDRVDEERQRLGDCWILADKLGSNSFKDIVAFAVIKLHSDDCPRKLYRTIYAHPVGRESKLKNFLVEWVVWNWQVEQPTPGLGLHMSGPVVQDCPNRNMVVGKAAKTMEKAVGGEPVCVP